MKLSGIVITSAIAIAVAVGFTAAPSVSALAADAHSFKGKITKTDRGGRVLVINGKKYRVSGSRSDVCIKGACDQDRADLKAGMKCKGKTSSKKNGMELKKISCK